MKGRISRKLRHWPVVASAAFFHAFGVAGTRPLVPLLAREMGISAAEIGVLVAAFAVLPLMLAIRVGRWMDSHSTRPLMIAGTLLAAIGLLLPVFVPGRTGLYGSQLLTGSAFTIFILSAQKSVGGLSDHPWTRERSVAVFSMGIALGSLIGPLSAGYLSDLYDIYTAFTLLGLTMLFGVLFVCLVEELPAAAVSAKLPMRSGKPLEILGYHRYMGRAFLISSLILLAKDMFVTYFPLHAQNAGLSTTAIGMIIGLHNGGGVMVRLLSLPLVRLMGKNRVVVSSILCSGVLFLILPAADSILTMTMIAFGIGLGLGIGQPLSISTTIALSPCDKVGQVLGLRLSCNRLTQVGSPLLFGGLVLWTGIAGIFGLVGAILLAGTLRLSIPDQTD